MRISNTVFAVGLLVGTVALAGVSLTSFAYAAKEVLTRSPAAPLVGTGPRILEIKSSDYRGQCDSYELKQGASADAVSDMLADMSKRVVVSGCVRAWSVR